MVVVIMGFNNINLRTLIFVFLMKNVFLNGLLCQL